MKREVVIIGFLLFLIIEVIVCTSQTSNAASKPIDIKFATVAPDGSSWVKHMRQLNQRLKVKSNGMISLKIYAGGIAGDEVDVLKKIKIGQIHSAAFSGLGITHILPMMRVLDLPFLFRNQKEIEAVRNEIYPQFSQYFREAGFELLDWAEIGDIHIFSKKAVRKISDISGVKIWTWSGDPVSKKTLTIMGTNPIPLAITDVTTALNTNMIDTVYAPLVGALALQWHSYVKYMNILPISHSTGAVLISRNYFEKIPPDLSRMFKSEIQLMMKDLTVELTVQNADAIALIQKGGVELIPVPGKSELDQFYRVHSLVAKELSDILFPKTLLDNIYESLERVRTNR